PFEFAGVKSANTTTGHRTLGSPAILVRTVKQYRNVLRQNFVLADPVERRKKLENELQALAEKHNLRIHTDPGLLDRVTYLNEFPSAILGSFDPGFVSLPQEFLINVMGDHEKYFALEKKSGGLAPHF